MATIILNHKVKDYSSWKSHYDNDSARRSGAGLKEIAVGQKSDDPSMVYIIWETADPSVLDKMLADPDLKNAMDEAGVISKPEVVMVR
jgi:hypothetical protein